MVTKWKEPLTKIMRPQNANVACFTSGNTASTQDLAAIAANVLRKGSANMKTKVSELMKLTLPQLFDKLQLLEDAVLSLVKSDPELKKAIIRASKAAELAATDSQRLQSAAAEEIKVGSHNAQRYESCGNSDQ
jgi:hypothetical protein